MTTVHVVRRLGVVLPIILFYSGFYFAYLHAHNLSDAGFADEKEETVIDIWREVHIYGKREERVYVIFPPGLLLDTRQ